MSHIQVEPVPFEQKSVLVQLLNLYNYDFTEYEDDYISEDGYYKNESYRHIITDEYRNDDARHSFFIRVNQKLAGFILVHEYCRFLEKAHTIAEFFVMKSYRRKGVGKLAAKIVFDMFKGKWEVLQLTNNLPAQKFWEAVISEYTETNYQKCDSEEWVGFIFETGEKNEAI